MEYKFMFRDYTEGLIWQGNDYSALLWHYNRATECEHKVSPIINMTGESNRKTEGE